MLGDPQGLLRDLLAETVHEISGHRPGRETITEFLQGLSGDGVTESKPSVPSAHSKDHNSSEHGSERSVSSKVRKRKARKKMSTRVLDGHLLVKFADTEVERWKLPDRLDKEAIRCVRDKAVAFARDNGATLGQINAVKKALAGAGYYLTKPRRPLN